MSNILPTSTWFPPLQMGTQTRYILFCFPYAGGGTGIFRHWPHTLLPGIYPCPIQLPGREMRLKDAPYASMERLASDIADEIAAQCPLPFIFFGHSMGALLSFEVARALRLRYHREPAHIFVAGQRAPHLPPRIPYPSKDASDAELVEEIRQAGGIPETVLSNPLLMRLVLSSLRADLSLCASYSYKEGPQLQCPISAYGGDVDEQVHISDLKAWEEHTSGSFQMSMWRGGHFFWFQKPEEMTERIRQAMLL